jgi:hypothetical protein
MTQVQESIRLAKVHVLEDDIRALEHYLAFGYFQHPRTKDAMRNLLVSLKEELTKL